MAFSVVKRRSVKISGFTRTSTYIYVCVYIYIYIDISRLSVNMQEVVSVCLSHTAAAVCRYSVVQNVL
jgi:hypothetical protein